MHGLPDPGRLSYSAAVHQGPPGQDLAGEAAAPEEANEARSSEEASATFCSRGPAGGKRESTQVSACLLPGSLHLEEWGQVVT